MELFDILDKDGKLTGLTATKGTQLQDGHYYLGVHVYIYNSAMEFLLQQRSYDKAFLPGGWEAILEHAVAGENSMECAIRGIKEEVGLRVQNDVRFVWRTIWEEYRHIIDVYFVEMDFSVDDLSLEPGKVIGAKFVSKKEMLTHISNMHYRPEEYRRYMTNKIKMLTYTGSSLISSTDEGGMS